MKSVLIAFAACASVVNADMYLHNMRGSNNRLNEKNANRNNANRLFNSQNNNRGGYNVGDKTEDAFTANGGNEPGSPFPDEKNQDQYIMTYYETSALRLEITSQHGCGGNEATNPNKLNCNIVYQYMCNSDPNDAETASQLAMKVRIIDGRNTNTPDEANSLATADAQHTTNNNNNRGRHEHEAYYRECKERPRNKGLFIADQKVKDNNGATNTRQNPNGGRSGLECPEERDYYPYWHPSPWVDVAYMTTNLVDCGASTELSPRSFDIRGNSQNNNMLYKCIGNTVENQIKAIKATNETLCTALNAETPGAFAWQGFTHGVKQPDCLQADWTRVNQLGNSVAGQMAGYNWTLPALNKAPQAATATGPANLPNNAWIRDDTAKCVLRARYNISTDDYDPNTVDWESNYNRNKGIISPVQQNPTVDIGANLQGLRLAINTAQFGRTFQDRSHAFYLKKLPVALGNKNVVNLNVRGKRGNIVQTFPAMEYDFVPNILEVKPVDAVHVQWTGSNTHNNGNPAGDGQAGDAGEGKGGTDRNNMLPLLERKGNYPVPLDTGDASNSFLEAFNCLNGVTAANVAKNDCAVHLATSGKYKTVAEATAGDAINPTLDEAPASLVGGMFLIPNNAVPSTGKSFHYMSTRNNNLSNRGQKGSFNMV